MSNIIKPHAKANKDAEYLAPVLSDDNENAGFKAFDSMWQGGSSEATALAVIKKKEVEAQQKADALIRQAQSEAAAIEKQAYEKGFNAGREEGLKVAAAKTNQIEQLLRKIEKERATLYRQYEEDVVGMVMLMVNKIVDHEVSVNPRVILACLKNALSYVIENSTVKVHLNGNDFARVREVSIEDPELLEGFTQLELIEDQAIAEGGCLLETEFGEIDATLENRKEALAKAINQFFMQALAAV